MPTTLYQLPVAIAMVYGGLAAGMLYDIIGLVRVIASPGRLGNAVLDAVFWLLCGGICFLVLYWANGGEMRLYCIAAFALGAAIYLFGISRALKHFFAAIARFFKERRKGR